MKISNLVRLLNNEISSEDFLAEFPTSLKEYEVNLEKIGSYVTLRVDEDTELIISIRDIVKLCELFVSGKLSNTVLSYIADSMQLCDSIDFQSEDIADYVAELTDPEINGVFTKERAAEVISMFT